MLLIPRDEKLWWALKIVTLLHDVPWKPWLISGEYRGRRPAQEILNPEARKIFKDIVNSIGSSFGDLEANDEEAIAFILYLFDGLEQSVRDTMYSVVKGYWSTIHEADVRASSADRLLIPKSQRPLRPKKFVNIFRPELTVDIHKPSEEVIARYLNEVKKIVEKASQRANSVEEALKKIYFALFALMETTWYKVAGSNAIPPADTRMPHHTVFHHLYASTAMLNTIGCWAIVEIDTPGIQVFVRQGRKTRDFWAGSWLISFLIWKAVEAFVNVFGPDVVLSPAIFLNPFYLDTILGIGAVDEADLPFIAWSSRWPEQPVVPGTVRLIIPIPCTGNRDAYPYTAWLKLLSTQGTGDGVCRIETIIEGGDENLENCVKTIVNHSVRDVWSRIVDNVLNDKSVSYLIDQTCSDAEESKHSECVALLLEYLSSAKNSPPIIHRVAAVRITDDMIKKDIEDLINRDVELEKVLDFLGGFIEKDIGLRRDRLADFIANIFRIPYAQKKLRERLDSKPLIAVGVGVTIAKSIQEFTSKIYINGVLPRYRICSLCGRIPAAVYLPRGGDQSKVEYILDEGEALCPYCLVRRMLGKHPSKVLKGVIYSSPSERGVLSTLDVANIWNLELAKELEHGIGENYEHRYEYKIEPYRIIVEEIGKRDLSKWLLSMDIMLSQRGLDVVAEASTVLAQKLKSYVAYVIGDGDNIGRGYWKGVLPKPSEYSQYSDYLKNQLDTSITSDVIWSRIEPNIVYLYRVINSSELHSSIDMETIRRWLNAYGAVAYIGKVIDLVDPDALVLITPSYVYTLSHSLLISSLVDALIVESLGGVLIYAGGDDTAVIAPVHGSVTNIDNKYIILPLYTLSVALSRILPRDLRIDSVEKLYDIIEGELFGDFRWIIEKVDSVPIPLLLVFMMRLNYWGMILALAGGNVKGYHIYEGVFTPAVAAYGKSYGVLISHYRDPMWLSYSVAAELCELKGAIKVVDVDRVAVDKDLLISMYGRVQRYIGVEDIASESSLTEPLSGLEISVIPLSLRSLNDVGTLVKSLLRIYTCIEAGDICRKSLIYSVMEPSTKSLLLNLSESSLELAKNLLVYLIKRHVSESVADKVCDTLLDAGVEAYRLSMTVGAKGKGFRLPAILSVITLLRFLSSAG